MWKSFWVLRSPWWLAERSNASQKIQVSPKESPKVEFDKLNLSVTYNFATKVYGLKLADALALDPDPSIKTSEDR
jgi:hypothetical protein